MKIREFRKRAGLTQTELAERLNVNQSAVSNWENSKFCPVRKYRKALADALNCKESDLMEISESSEPPHA